MFKVDKLQPYDYPGRCMALPYRTADPDGFFVGEELEGPPFGGVVRQAISAEGVRHVARKHFDMVDKAALDEVQAEVEALRAQLAEKDIELENANARIDAIDLFESAGFRARKKPGPRKPGKEN